MSFHGYAVSTNQDELVSESPPKKNPEPAYEQCQVLMDTTPRQTARNIANRHDNIEQRNSVEKCLNFRAIKSNCWMSNKHVSEFCRRRSSRKGSFCRRSTMKS